MTDKEVFHYNGTTMDDLIPHIVDNKHDHHEEFWEEEFAHYNLGVGTVIVGILGLFGNILILVVFIKKGNITSTDIYRLNLACTDLLFTVIATIIRFGPLNLLGYDPLMLHPAFCTAWMHLLFTAESSSAWTIVAVTLERLLVVYVPLRARSFINKTVAIITVITIDVFWLSMYSLFHFGYGPVYKPVGPGGSLVMVAACGPDSSSSPGHFYYQLNVRPWQDFIFFFGIPCCVIMVSNSLIIAKLVSQARLRREMSRMEETGRQKHSLTITLLVVSFAFLICVMPLRILVIIYGNSALGMKVVTRKQAIQSLYWSFAINLSRLNYAINFILYCLCGKDFRDNVKTCAAGCKSLHWSACNRKYKRERENPPQEGDCRKTSTSSKTGTTVVKLSDTDHLNSAHV